MTINEFVAKFLEVIIQPLMWFLFALALLYFVWGVAVFIARVNSDDGRKEGAKHIMWGLIGMAVMISVYGIITLLENTIYQGEPPPYSDPNFPNNVFPQNP